MNLADPRPAPPIRGQDRELCSLPFDDHAVAGAFFGELWAQALALDIFSEFQGQVELAGWEAAGVAQGVGTRGRTRGTPGGLGGVNAWNFAGEWLERNNVNQLFDDDWQRNRLIIRVSAGEKGGADSVEPLMHGVPGDFRTPTQS